MAWKYDLEQQKDSDGNLIPFWKVTHYNTDKPNKKHESFITQEIKDHCYA